MTHCERCTRPLPTENWVFRTSYRAVDLCWGHETADCRVGFARREGARAERERITRLVRGHRSRVDTEILLEEIAAGGPR